MSRLRPRLAAVAALLFAVLVPASPALAEGRRLPARVSASSQSAGHEPVAAVDGQMTTMWLAAASPSPKNNSSWYQLDFGAPRRVATLNWLAATGSPYPAGYATRYHVLVSQDGVSWTPAGRSDTSGTPTVSFGVHRVCRFVRLVTDQVLDGSGWALGLREVWATEDAPPVEVPLSVTPVGDALRLSWSAPPGVRTRVLRGDSPLTLKEWTTAPAAQHELVDAIEPNLARFYRVELLVAGRPPLSSPIVAGVRHARAPAPETYSFFYDRFAPPGSAQPTLERVGDPVVVHDESSVLGLVAAQRRPLPYLSIYASGNWAATPPTADDLADVGFSLHGFRFADGLFEGYFPTRAQRPGSPYYTPKRVQYTTCPNSAALRSRVLARIEDELRAGAGGFFIDNGFDDDIAAPTACESTTHHHVYGELTGAQSFIGLMSEVSVRAKRHDPHAIVLVNEGVLADARFYGLGLGDVSDGELWESYLFTTYVSRAHHATPWSEVYRRSVERERAQAQQQTYVMSYPWTRDEAFFAYATARLCALPFAAALGKEGAATVEPAFPELTRIRLGHVRDPRQVGGTRTGAVYQREYEDGVVLVNPDDNAHEITLPMPTGVRDWRELATGSQGKGAVIVALPAHSGRVVQWTR